MARRTKKHREIEKSEELLKAAEHESEFMLKVEEGTAEVDVSHLKNLHRDELLEIRDFVDEEKEPALYAAVNEAIRLHVQPRIQIARIDERVWSYFYDKYILRVLLALWVAVVFFVIGPLLPQTADIRNLAIPVAVGGALFFIVFWRVLLAKMEAGQPSGNAGSSPVRRKLGIRVVMADGSPPGLLRSFARGMLKAFPLYFITLVTMEIARNNRGLHDRLFGTYVVRINARDVTRSELAAFIRENF